MKKATHHQQLMLFSDVASPAPAEHHTLGHVPSQQIPHHHIEVGYSDGTREVTCTASGRDPRTYRQDQLYAGFVGPGYATFEECPLCNPKSEQAIKEQTLFTFGYLSTKSERILAELIALQVPIVDIRFSPTSRRYEWTQEALSKRLGTQYSWVQSLGNELYKEALTGNFAEPHIRLHNAEDGLAELQAILYEHGRAAIFCACSNKTKCHRTTVARITVARLAEQSLACKVIHL